METDQPSDDASRGTWNPQLDSSDKFHGGILSTALRDIYRQELTVWRGLDFIDRAEPRMARDGWWEVLRERGLYEPPTYTGPWRLTDEGVSRARELVIWALGPPSRVEGASQLRPGEPARAPGVELFGRMECEDCCEIWNETFAVQLVEGERTYWMLVANSDRCPRCRSFCIRLFDFG